MFNVILILASLWLATPANAANPTCPTRPDGDNTNACASTAFVKNALDNYLINIESNGASTSTATTTCTSAVGSNKLTACGDTSTFKVGQEVLMFGAGSTPDPATTPLSVTAVPCPAFTSAWCSSAPWYAPATQVLDYCVSAVMRNGAIGEPRCASQITNGPKAIAATTPVQIEIETGSSLADAYVVSGRSSGSMLPIGVTFNIAQGSPARVKFDDYGRDNPFGLVFQAQPWLPQTQITAPRPGWLRAKITAVTSTSITLATTAGTAVTGAVYHVNDSAILDTIAGANIARVPCGTYNISGEAMSITGANKGIIGDARGCVTLSVVGGILYRAAIWAVSAPNFVVENIIIDNHDYAQPRTAAVLCNTCSDMRIKGVVAKDITYFGINWLDTPNAIVEDSGATDNYPALSPNQCMNYSAVTGNPNVKILNAKCVGTGLFGWLGKGSLVEGADVSGACFGAALAGGSTALSQGYAYRNNYLHDTCNGTVTASFTGNAPGTDQLTVTGISGNLHDTYPSVLSGSGVPAGLRIIGQVSGTAFGNGVYQLNKAATLSNVAMEARVGLDANNTGLSCIETWGDDGSIIGNRCENTYWFAMKIGGARTNVINNVVANGGKAAFQINSNNSGTFKATDAFFSGNRAFDTGDCNQDYGLFGTYTTIYGVQISDDNVWSGCVAPTLLVRGNQVLKTQVDATTTTLAYVDEWWANAAAGETYEVDLEASFTGDAAGGIKVGVAGTVTASSIRVDYVLTCNTTNAVVGTLRQTTLGGTLSYSAGCTSLSLKAKGIMTISAQGGITPWFAQAVASGTSSLLAQSKFVVTRSQM